MANDRHRSQGARVVNLRRNLQNLGQGRGTSVECPPLTCTIVARSGVSDISHAQSKMCLRSNGIARSLELCGQVGVCKAATRRSQRALRLRLKPSSSRMSDVRLAPWTLPGAPGTPSPTRPFASVELAPFPPAPSTHNKPNEDAIGPDSAEFGAN